jgi:hypothetical protein
MVRKTRSNRQDARTPEYYKTASREGHKELSARIRAEIIFLHDLRAAMANPTLAPRRLGVFSFFFRSGVFA